MSPRKKAPAVVAPEKRPARAPTPVPVELRAAVRRAFTPAERALHALEAVPDHVADQCAACGAAFNRPLGFDASDLCPVCLARTSVSAEALEEAERKAEALSDEAYEESERRVKAERAKDAAEDRIEDLLTLLRDVDRALADVRDPEALKKAIGDMEIRERVREALS